MVETPKVTRLLCQGRRVECCWNARSHAHVILLTLLSKEECLAMRSTEGTVMDQPW